MFLRIQLNVNILYTNTLEKSVDVYVLDTGNHYNHSLLNDIELHYPGCNPVDKCK